jgi:FixJ family two-component response regulator
VREGFVTGSPDNHRRPVGRGPEAALTVAEEDDDPSVRPSLERLLRTAGLSVVTYASAEQFLALCRREGLSCLILDVHLGGMSGLELLARLTAAGCTVPVVFITAYDDPQSAEAIQRSGGVGFLRKPFDDRALIDAITDAVAGRG